MTRYKYSVSEIQQIRQMIAVVYCGSTHMALVYTKTIRACWVQILTIIVFLFCRFLFFLFLSLRERVFATHTKLAIGTYNTANRITNHV